MTGFGERLAAALSRFGPLCVGIDPHDELLRAWGLDVSAAGARTFGLSVVDAAAGRVGIVKPQVAFYERFGSAGYAALEDVLAAARAADLLTIADAKRGDIGTTMHGYATAWLSPESPLAADAVTLSPYLGPESLRETISFAIRHGRGVFLLAGTSNPEALAVQSAITADASAGESETVAARIVRDVADINVGSPGPLGPVGFVVGATVDRGRLGLGDVALAGAPLLAPGFGAQGAEPRDLPKLFGYVARAVVANESRSILSAGRDGLVTRIEERIALYAEALDV